MKSCAAGAGDANLRKGDEGSDVVVAGRAANERVKAVAAAAAADDDEGSTLSTTADAAPRLEAARARRSIGTVLSRSKEKGVSERASQPGEKKKDELSLSSLS